MKTVAIYTDGACSGNPGAGGWAAILIYNEHSLELSGYEDNTTNNRMELTGPIRALEKLKEPCKVMMYSDSSYVVDGFNKNWVKGWKRRGWKRSNGQPVLNPELWKRLDELVSMHDVTWHWVKGHADNLFNNRCDELATGEIKKHRR